MSQVAGEILQAVVGNVGAGPTGFDVHYQVKNDAVINGSTNMIDADLNEQSLARARAHNEGGSNKEVAKTLEPAPKTGSALASVALKQEKADNMYGELFKKRGLSSIAERAMSASPSGFRRSDHRAVLGQAGTNKESLSKNPLMRVKQRQLLRLRKTFAEIAQAKKKTVALNADSLPEQTKTRLIESAIERGEQNTPFGQIPAPHPQSDGRSLASTAMDGARLAVGAATSPTQAARTGIGMAMKKWDAVGALMGGSFVDLAPRPKRT
jgi:hypothetical protein